MPDRIPINDISSVEKSRIVFDTNIWIYLYGPASYPDNYLTKMYSRVYSSTIKNDNTVIIDNYVISEFSNRYIRIHHEIMKNGGAPAEFKKFRKTDDFKVIGDELRDVILNIIEDCCVEFLSPEEIKFEEIFNTVAEGNLDITDVMILSMCKSRGYYLLTHDSDFINENINIITGNKKMLL